ncbi:MAG: putative DNA-binding domain-containing protein, partial [Leisingera sp.]
PQAEFPSALMDAAQSVPEGLTDPLDHPAGRRFSVYRNNAPVSLTEPMHTAFPVIAKLLGKQNMDGLAGIYLRRHPPSSPLMMFYGEHYPEFLEGMEQLKHLGYLGDTARLELALRRAYHAADAAPIAPEALGVLTPDALMNTCLTLAPAVQVLRSPWPIHGLWRYNTEDGAPKPEAQAQDVLITRPEFDPIPQVLPPAGAVWINALMGGATIGEALEQAAAEDETFDLGATLALLLQGGAITGLDSKG